MFYASSGFLPGLGVVQFGDAPPQKSIDLTSRLGLNCTRQVLQLLVV